MTDAVARFAFDLREAGIVSGEVVSLYDRALTEATGDAWERFYRATFRELSLLERPRSWAAAESLLRLVEDDFGVELFGDLALRRLRASFDYGGHDDSAKWSTVGSSSMR